MNTLEQFNSFAPSKELLHNQSVTEVNTAPVPIQEREALLLMQANDLANLSVYRHIGRNGWVIKLKTKSIENNEHVLATKRERTRRIFKTSDAALRWCKKIGFEEIDVYL